MSARLQTTEERMQDATEHCQAHIDWYTREKKKCMNRYAIFQTGAIGLSAITPVLILWSIVPTPLQALPAALASIAAALTATFKWRDNQVRFATAGETLKTELFYFKSRTSKDYGLGVDDEMALNTFVTRVESLVLSETAEWRAEVTARERSSKTA